MGVRKLASCGTAFFFRTEVVQLSEHPPFCYDGYIRGGELNDCKME